MPITPAPFESFPNHNTLESKFKRVGRKALLLAGILVGSAYAVGSRATAIVQDAGRAYIAHEYDESENVE